MSTARPPHRVLEAIRAGACSWERLKAVTRLNDDLLGIAIAELLDARLIWTAEQDGGRVYGLEWRRGLVPRGAHPRRRTGE